MLEIEFALLKGECLLMANQNIYTFVSYGLGKYQNHASSIPSCIRTQRIMHQNELASNFKKMCKSRQLKG